ncbi:hypothetical protein [Clostridium sp. HMP27]|uniref:hypothetical protein n=1 Tax=Clostridium sp. HMP27 TaxID=1487921 RepID=UPI00052D9A5C|nr:hypothetical protein [Clostridium sp. HMP27]KGK85439.1 hypothetical protein DP68_16170 [Clostridium sp. HMP27]
MNNINCLQNGLQGQYCFSNDLFINIDNTIDENKHIVIHENVHKQLSSMSTIGLLLIMMEKTRIIDGSKKWLFDNLLDSSNKLQEQVATNIEYLWILQNYGFEQYMKKIEELSKNKTYAKHFNSLDIINKNVKTADDAKQAIETILLIGILSLNINLDIFPLWEFKNEKDFQRYLSMENNNIKYNPNTRFKVLLKYFFKPNYIQADYNKVEFVNSTTYGSDEINDLCRQTIQKIYKNSQVLDRILQRILCIDSKNHIKIDIEDTSVLSAYPTDLNAKQMKIKYEFTDLDKIIALLKAENNSVLRFEHLLAGLEDISLLSYWPLNRNEIYAGMYNIEDIINIVKNVENPIVFVQSKLFEKIGKKILKYFKFRTTYILMENAIGSSLSFIYREFIGGKYTVLKDLKYDILVLIKSNVILIQLVVKDLIKDYSTIFTEDKDIKFINSMNINAIDEYLIRSISSQSFIFNQNILKDNNIF